MSLQTITDLCMAINAVEGTEVSSKYIKQNERVRKTLYDLMINHASMLYMGIGCADVRVAPVTLKKLDKAIKAAGWDDQHFEEYGLYLRIVGD